MKTILTCAACGHSSFSPYLTCTDYTVSKQEFHIIKCNQCSLLITSPRPADDSLKHFYESNNYISHTGKANNLINYLYLQIRKITLIQKRELLESLTSTKSILDYGCGTGALIAHLQKYQWQVAGFEPNDSASFSDKALPIFKDKTDIKGTYNIVSLWHVLEHIPEPAETLKEIKPFLHKNGKLLIAVPNQTSYDAKYYGRYWAAYDVPRHLYHFNKKSMEQLLLSAGFTIEKVLPMYFDSYYVSLLSEHYKGTGFLKYLKAFYLGIKSNLKASKTREHSSLIYIAKP